MFLLLTSRAIHGLVPRYVIELFNIMPRAIYDLRSNQKSLLDPPIGKMLALPFEVIDIFQLLLRIKEQFAGLIT